MRKIIVKKRKVKFRTEGPYDPNFVEKIHQGRVDIKNGKGIKIAAEDLWK